MSKKQKTNSTKNNNSIRRDALAIANRRLPYVKKMVFVTLSDRRSFHPDPQNRPLIDKMGKRLSIRRLSRLSSVLPRNRAVNLSLPSGLYPYAFGFSERDYIPKQSLVCIRRKQRREIIFALGKGGASRQKRPRFNSTSTLTCR